MKSKIPFFALIGLLMVSCTPTKFYCDKPSRFSDVRSYAICNAIDYPIFKGKVTDSSFNVDVMIANYYYRKLDNGTYKQLVDSYHFESITVSLQDSNKEVIKEYGVSVTEFSKQENGINYDKDYVKKSDFKLVYSFNLLSLIQTDYDDAIYFEIDYLHKQQSGEHIIDRCFSFSFAKNNELVSLSNFQVS